MERVMHQRNWRHLTAAPRSIHAMPLMKGTTDWTNKLINPPTNENNTHMKCYNSPCSDMFTRGVVVMETITLRTRTTMTTAAIDVSRLEIRGPSLTHSSHWHGVWLSQVVTSCLWRLLCAPTHTHAEMEAVVVIVIVTPILLLLPFINFLPPHATYPPLRGGWQTIMGFRIFVCWVLPLPTNEITPYCHTHTRM